MLSQLPLFAAPPLVSTALCCVYQLVAPRECAGAVVSWTFPSPTTAQPQPWPLCSAHEVLLCHCVGCDAPVSPYRGCCASCAVSAYF
jgi:hypothetical protein